MGTKLVLDVNDPFYEIDKVSVAGVAGSCYCCAQQLHVSFSNIEDLPLAHLNKENFYIFICDQCEEDISSLIDSGISNLSYDILWAIQESLDQGLYALEEQNGSVTPDDRDSLLFNLYQQAENKLRTSSKKNKILEAMSEGSYAANKPNKSSKNNS